MNKPHNDTTDVNEGNEHSGTCLWYNSGAMKLRPAQEEILAYTDGRMAVSAVPGSGKTFTLSSLAARLIADGRVNLTEDQQVLIVTYLNASVDTFRASVRRRLEELGLSPTGYDVRTLHSLALEIVKLATGGLGNETGPAVLDEMQSSRNLALAVDSLIEEHPETWRAFLPDDNPQLRARWRNITQSTAHKFIRTAKNRRLAPFDIADQMQIAQQQDKNEGELQATVAQSPLLLLMTSIYGRYQNILTRQGAMDFDDLIWQAATLLERRADLTAELRRRWPFVLEDEAQDSVPLQEVLIERLVGERGNWVRVGDPNQAITSTFTAAHPRHFNAFIDRPDVISRPLPNSGRSAPLIIGAANALLHWVASHHPVPEVRRHAFRPQDILPTPEGDAQPNPPDDEASIHIKVYKHREFEELPKVARLSDQYAQERADHTLAILVPTNQIGHELAMHLDRVNADYDNLLRGGGRDREIAAVLHAMLAVLVDPLNRGALVNAYNSLEELNHPAVDGPVEDMTQVETLLRSVHRPESFLFPADDVEMESSLPAGVAGETELRHLTSFSGFLHRIMDLRPLPVDDLVLTLGDELFAWDETNEADLATAYQIGTIMRQWRDTRPDWRLPELVAQLSDIAEGRQRLPGVTPVDLGYEPQPGRITLATQHGAKGLEWDAVFLVGIDGFWIPGDLDSPFLGVHDFLGGDPTAEVIAQLQALIDGESGVFAGRTATQSAHIEVICERLRLLYVGITRARRILHISRSRATRHHRRDRDAEAATALGVLYEYLHQTEER